MREPVAWQVRAYPRFWGLATPAVPLGPFACRWRAVLAALLFRARHGLRSRALVDPVEKNRDPGDIMW